MSSSLYEIVELENGEIALQRAGEDDAEPLVSIRFSDESLYYLDSARLVVAKAMIEAGLEVLGDLSEENDGLEETTDSEEDQDNSQLLH